MNELVEATVEVERELQARGYVYPKLVECGKLTDGEAKRRMKALRYVLYLLDQAGHGSSSSQAPTTKE